MNTSVSVASSNRQIQRAVDHVNAFWLPIDVDAYNELKEYITVSENFYSTDTLHHVASKDPYLYLHLIRELQKKDTTISAATVQDLQSILSRSPREISPHTKEIALNFQTSIHDQLLITLAGVVALAKKESTKEVQAYSAVLFRQLGISLIAWNYSNVFNEALLEVRPSKPLETVLTEKLGFSPTQLALSLMTNWHVEAEVKGAVSDNIFPENLSSDLQNFKDRIVTLRKICAISEALGRANHPEINSTAQKDWKFAAREITKSLGSDGLQTIETVFKTFVRDSRSLDPAKTLATTIPTAYSPPQEIYRVNRSLRDSLILIYDKMGTESSALPVLRELIKSVFPATAFKSLLVYTIEPISDKLQVQVRVGDPKYKVDSISLDSEADSIILKCLLTSKQIQIHSLQDDGGNGTVSGLARRLEINGIPIGVLYVETPSLLHEILNGTQRSEFQALAATLEDILTLV